MAAALRIGIDLGGTKIAAIALGGGDHVLFEKRIASPKNDYRATVLAIQDLVQGIETNGLSQASVGVGIPGSISPATGLVQNANSTWLNGKPLREDLTEILQRPVKLANDANCFALSEAVDGAGENARSVFGVIVGTGCGGGMVIDGEILDGPRGIGGEWGHNPLPWPNADELPGRQCWCGRAGCLETWISGPALSADHQRLTGEQKSPEELAALAQSGNAAAIQTLSKHVSRMARGLAMVVNIVDPEVIVIGGGLSNLEHLYSQLPEAMAPHIFADHTYLKIVPPRYGDASGVRGAARLWNKTDSV